jgi:hypothetical protein
MCPSRLPRRVAAATWPARPVLRRPCLHSEVVAALVADTCLDLAAAHAAACSYTQLKQRAAAAVRKRDVRVTRRADKSTVYSIWSIMGRPELYPNVCQQYLVGTLSAGQHVKFMCRSGMLLVGHRQHQLRQVATPACVYCRSCSDATLPHALLLRLW